MIENFSTTPTELSPYKNLFSSKAFQLQLFGLLICAGILLIQAAHFWPQTIDDSYITFRYARNLLNGYGLAFNPGEAPVEGFTNPTWLLLSSASIWAGVDPMLTTKIAGTLCSLVLLVVVNRAAATLRKREDLWNCAAPLVLAGNSSFAFWAVQGMETPLNTLLIFSTWFAFFQRTVNLTEKPWMFPSLVFLAFATRVDALWFLAGLPLLLIPILASAKSWWKPLLAQCLWASFGVLTIQFARMLYFGELLPNTLYAKSGIDLQDARGLAQLMIFYFQNGFTETGKFPLGQLLWANLLFFSLGTIALWGSWSLRIFILTPLVFQAAFMILSNGDWMPCFRFFQVILPFLAVASSLAIGLLLGKISRRFLKSLASILAAFLLLTSTLEQQRVEAVYIFSEEPLWFSREKGWWTPRQLEAQFQEGWSTALGSISAELTTTLPDGSSILLSDIGLPGWLMPKVQIIDVDGLTNRDLAFAASVRKPGATRDSHQIEFIENLLASENPPDYLLTFEQHFGKGPAVPGYVYPRVVSIAQSTPAFGNYQEIWKGTKAQGDVWNHLYQHNDCEPISSTDSLLRLRQELQLSPALGALLLPYATVALQNGVVLHQDVILMRALERNSANREVLYALCYLAETQKSASLALLLEEFAHPVLQTPLWDQTLLTAFKQSGLELEAKRLEDKINRSQRTNPLP